MVTIRNQQAADEKLLNQALGTDNYEIVRTPGGMMLDTGGVQTPYGEFMKKLRGADNTGTLGGMKAQQSAMHATQPSSAPVAHNVAPAPKATHRPAVRSGHGLG